MPESITATVTGKSCGCDGQNVQARSASRYHCCAASGSGFANAAAAAGTTSASERKREPRASASRHGSGAESPGGEPVPGRARTR